MPRARITSAIGRQAFTQDLDRMGCVQEHASKLAKDHEFKDRGPRVEHLASLDHSICSQKHSCLSRPSLSPGCVPRLRGRSHHKRNTHRVLKHGQNAPLHAGPAFLFILIKCTQPPCSLQAHRRRYLGEGTLQTPFQQARFSSLCSIYIL